MHGRLRFSFRCGQGRLDSEPRQRLLGFHLPLRAAESLRRSLIPLRGIGVAPGFLVKLREFKRHHRVIRGLVKSRKLRRRIFARSRFADSSLDMSPVRHVGIFYQ
jgi:hypothetical protein